MKVAFNIQPLLDNEKTGIGFYAAELVNRMVADNPQTDFSFEYFSFRNADIKRGQARKYLKSNCELNECQWFPGSAYRFGSSLLPVPYRFFLNSKADVTHFFNFIVPPFVHGKTVVTIHDMTIHRFPETIRAKSKYMLLASLKNSIKRADKIITVSEFSKQEIVRFYNCPSDKVTAIHAGVDLHRFNPNISQADIDSVKQKYQLPNEYLLYLGTLEPRKNIDRLLEAYAMCKSNVPKLVIAGREGWLFDGIYEKARNSGLEHNIIFTGYVDDGDKAALYAGAFGFLFPSLYEGFGSPPIEAMACGTPTLVSETASMPEVCGDCAVYVAPLSIDSIANGIEQLCADVALRDDLQTRGLEWVKKYDWDKLSGEVYRVYENLVN
jgi:glycosyltransferase involved in cell wall biosynthesis